MSIPAFCRDAQRLAQALSFCVQRGVLRAEALAGALAAGEGAAFLAATRLVAACFLLAGAGAVALTGAFLTPFEAPGPAAADMGHAEFFKDAPISAVVVARVLLALSANA